MQEFLIGATAMACWVAMRFFLRFWRETCDRLFLMFSAAFLLLGLTRFGLALSHEPSEGATFLYWAPPRRFSVDSGRDRRQKSALADHGRAQEDFLGQEGENRDNYQRASVVGRVRSWLDRTSEPANMKSFRVRRSAAVRPRPYRQRFFELDSRSRERAGIGLGCNRSRSNNS